MIIIIVGNTLWQVAGLDIHTVDNLGLSSYRRSGITLMLVTITVLLIC